MWTYIMLAIQAASVGVAISITLMSRRNMRTMGRLLAEKTEELCDANEKLFVANMQLEAARRQVDQLMYEKPNDYELQYVYNSLGVAPPSEIQASIDKRTELFESIMSDLEGTAEPSSAAQMNALLEVVDVEPDEPGPHDFAPGYTGYTCEQMYLDKHGDAEVCGLDPDHHLHHQDEAAM